MGGPTRGPVERWCGVSSSWTADRVVDELLDVAAERPVAPPGLADELEATIAAGTRGLIPDAGLWFGKGRLLSVARCEGQAAAQAAAPRAPVTASPPLVAGMVAHKGMQASQSHAGLPVGEYVVNGLSSVRRQDPDVDQWWQGLGPVDQSEVLSSAANAVAAWRDQWPVLPLAWEPRWEPTVRVTVGGLTLSARPDLVLGTARRNGLQTMVVADLKTGPLRPDHAVEADFHALLATLKWRVPPWRSVVYSVLTGSWSLPADVDADRLAAAADSLVSAVKRWVAVVDAGEPAVLTPGPHCRWCPVSASCDALSDGEWSP